MRARLLLIRSGLIMVASAVALPASASISRYESLELLVDRAPHIAIARVTHIRDTWQPSNWGARDDYRLVGADITSVLKGKPPTQIEFRATLDRSLALPDSGAEYLLFFDSDTTVHRAVDLSFQDYEEVMTAHFEMIETRDSLLDVIGSRLAAATVWPRIEWACTQWKPEPVVRGVPGNVPPTPIPWSGSPRLLLVPPDSEFEQMAHDLLKADYVRDREAGANWLANYPSKENVTLLRALLEDSGTAVILRSGGMGTPTDTIVYYPAREAAYRALQGMCVDVPKPEGYREPDDGIRIRPILTPPNR